MLPTSARMLVDVVPEVEKMSVFEMPVKTEWSELHDGSERQLPAVRQAAQNAMKPPQRIHAVVRGRSPGIDIAWKQVMQLVNGFRGNIFKSFRT